MEHTDSLMIDVVLVDPFAKTVTDVQVDSFKDFIDFQERMQCEYIEVEYWRMPPAGIPGVPVIYVDAEGWHKRQRARTRLAGYHSVIAGRFVILHHCPTKRHPADSAKVKAANVLPFVEFL